MQAQPILFIMESMPAKVRSLAMATIICIGMVGHYVMIEMYMIIRGGIFPREAGHSKWLEVIWMIGVFVFGVSITGYWFLYPRITMNGKASSSLNEGN